MTRAWTRREAVRAALALGGLATLSGCSATRSGATGVGSVGDPLPGESVAGVEHESGQEASGGGARADRLLERYRQRGTRSTLPDGVVERARWSGEGPDPALADLMEGIERITVHHDGMSPFRSGTKRDAMRRIESIRRAHRGRGWADIGYHFAIDRGGRIYQCRPLRLQGAHVKYHNERNLGVLVLGNFMEQRPTTDARSALDAFVGDQMRRYGVPLSRVFTHQELRPTACPGDSLQRHMESARSGRGALASV